MTTLPLLQTVMIMLSCKPVESESSPRSVTAILAYRWPMESGTSPPTEVNQFYLRNVNYTGKTSIVYTSLAARGYVKEYDLTTWVSTDLVSLTEVGPIAKGHNDELIYCDPQKPEYIFKKVDDTLTVQYHIDTGVTRPHHVAALAWDSATSAIYAVRPGSEEGSLELLRVPHDGNYTSIAYQRRGTVVGLEYYDNFLYIAVNELGGTGVVDQLEINPTSPGPPKSRHSYHFPGGDISTNSLGVGKVDVQPP
ncbi:hypothetical protein FOL47_002332, partial [Perkinsus chesapeaki]